MKDVPSNCPVAGNPARIMEKGIKTGPGGLSTARSARISVQLRPYPTNRLPKKRLREADRR